MVYAFTLPTTGHLSLQTCIASDSHPSLPQAASTARHALRQALKTYKRLPRGAQRDAQLAPILTAITEYLPYLLTISKALNTTPLDPSSTAPAVEITLRGDLEPEWRPTLTASSARTLNHPPPRTRGHGLDFEIAFVLTTMGYVLSRLAHIHVIRTLYNRTTPSAEQRTTAVQSATKHLLQASAVHTLLASMPAITTTVPDLDPATQAALASLALAEATLLAVLKDDSYVAACIQARNPNDKDWMVRAPEIPKVRAHLFARLCLRAAEYADQAAAGLGAGAGKASVDDDLKRYVAVLGRVSRARACRFFGADAELAGKIGEGIAWLRAAKSALGVRGTHAEPESETKSRGLSKLKQGWMERREERRMGKDAGSREYTTDKGELGPGDNAGREEEGRVIEMLETKWVHMNDTVNTQLIPPSADLLANLPSGRDIHSPPAPYKIPALDEETLLHMRGPPREEAALQFSSDADSDEEPVGGGRTFTPGAVPERTDSAYY